MRRRAEKNMKATDFTRKTRSEHLEMPPAHLIDESAALITRAFE